MSTTWGTPGAKLILPTDAPHGEWLRMRTHGLGGSDMAILTGNSHYQGQSVYNLWLDKTGQTEPDEAENDIFRYGHDIEYMLAKWFTEDTGIKTRNAGMFANKIVPWAFANPDRLTEDGGVLEIKTTSSWTDNGRSYKAGVVPLAHLDQVQWYMRVLGRHRAHVIALVDLTPYIIPVEYNPDHAARLMELGAEFWAHVESGEPPDVDPYTVTADELSARFPADGVDPESVAEAAIPEEAEDDWRNLIELRSERDQIADEIKEIETRVKARVGDREYLAAEGRPLFRWAPVAGRKTFDKAAVVAKLAADRGLEGTKQELKSIEAEFTKQGHPTRRLTIIEKEIEA
jgi:putative phage-type endonuclease